MSVFFYYNYFTIVCFLVLNVSFVTSADLSSFIGLQHFQPCYFINATLPCLLDGAQLINSRVGSRLFKFALKQSTPQMYPWNNVGQWAWPRSVSSLAELASTNQIRTLLSQTFLGTNFTTFVIWAYTIGLDDGYWCRGVITDADQEKETTQFHDLTLHLMSSYAGSGVTFVLEHWEGDWAARCGNYNTSVPPAPQVVSNMVKWLQARQSGVESGRRTWCALQRDTLNAPLDCADQKEIMRTAAVSVMNSCEVNLVLASIQSAFPNLIRSVVPHVSLDMLSYSSYEAQSNPQLLGSALDFMYSQMNKSTGAPQRPIFITDWGVPLEQVDPAQAVAVAKTVLSTALSRSFVAHIFHWQIINNELKDVPGNCAGLSAPVFESNLQRDSERVLGDPTEWTIECFGRFFASSNKWHYQCASKVANYLITQT